MLKQMWGNGGSRGHFRYAILGNVWKELVNPLKADARFYRDNGHKKAQKAQLE
jgi:hypothetical protein